MKKQKFLCLLLAAVLVALAGCSGNSGHPGGTVTPVQSTPAPTQTTAPVQTTAPTQATEPIQTTAPTQGTTAPTDPDVDENLSLGRMEGGVYTNSYVGLRCTLDTDWIYYGVEELQEVPGNIGEMMSGSELGDAMANYTQVMDMMAENTDMLTSINVVYVKQSLADRAAYLSMTEEQIIDSVLAQKDAMIDAYNQAGITVKSMDKVTVTFMGQQRTALRTEAEVSGIAYYTLQFFYHHLGSYSVTLTVSSYVEDRTVDLLELFTAI